MIGGVYYYAYCSISLTLHPKFYISLEFSPNNDPSQFTNVHQIPTNSHWSKYLSGKKSWLKLVEDVLSYIANRRSYRWKFLYAFEISLSYDSRFGMSYDWRHKTTHLVRRTILATTHSDRRFWLGLKKYHTAFKDFILLRRILSAVFHI